MVFLSLILSETSVKVIPNRIHGILTCQANEEDGDVLDVGRITCCIMVHLVCFPGLILYNVEQDVNSRIRIVGCGTISIVALSTSKTSDTQDPLTKQEP